MYTKKTKDFVYKCVYFKQHSSYDKTIKIFHNLFAFRPTCQHTQTGYTMPCNHNRIFAPDLIRYVTPTTDRSVVCFPYSSYPLRISSLIFTSHFIRTCNIFFLFTIIQAMNEKNRLNKRTSSTNEARKV